MIQLSRGAAVIAVLWLVAVASAQQRFSQLTGSLTVQPVRDVTPLEVPFITWGGDVATFHANGGLVTKKGSLYDQLGLQLKLTPHSVCLKPELLRSAILKF